MHFIPLQSRVCVSYHCRNGMTSYYVVIATKGSDFDGFMTLKESNLLCNFAGPSCYGNRVVYSLHFCNGMKCIPCAAMV